MNLTEPRCDTQAVHVTCTTCAVSRSVDEPWDVEVAELLRRHRHHRIEMTFPGSVHAPEHDKA